MFYRLEGSVCRMSGMVSNQKPDDCNIEAKISKYTNIVQNLFASKRSFFDFLLAWSTDEKASHKKRPQTSYYTIAKISKWS